MQVKVLASRTGNMIGTTAVREHRLCSYVSDAWRSFEGQKLEDLSKLIGCHGFGESRHGRDFFFLKNNTSVVVCIQTITMHRLKKQKGISAKKSHPTPCPYSLPALQLSSLFFLHPFPSFLFAIEDPFSGGSTASD